jgi:hypothetical protein
MIFDETLKKIESIRQMRFASFITNLVFAGLFAIAGLVLMGLAGTSDWEALYRYIGAAAFFVVFFFVAFLFVLGAIHQRKLYEKEFNAAVVPYLLPKEYQDFAYLLTPDYQEFVASLKNVLVQRPEPDPSSYYQGRLQGTHFYSFGYSYIKTDGKTTRESGGRFLEFTLPHAFPFELILKDKRSPSYFKKTHLLIRLKSDSQSFDELHDVTANKEVEGMNLLSPTFVNALEKLNADYGVKISARFSGDRVSIYADDYGSRYQNLLSKRLTAERLLALQKEILLPLAVYEAFALESPFYSI